LGKGRGFHQGEKKGQPVGTGGQSVYHLTLAAIASWKVRERKMSMRGEKQWFHLGGKRAEYTAMGEIIKGAKKAFVGWKLIGKSSSTKGTKE